MLGRFSTDYPAGKKIETYTLAYRRHMQPEIALCGLIRRLDGKLIGNCPMCVQAQEAAKSPHQADRQATTRWKAQVRYAVQLIDLNDSTRTVKRWDAPAGLIDHIEASMNSSEYAGEELVGTAGRDLIIRYSSKSASPQTVYGYLWVDSRKNTDLTSAAPQVVDLYNAEEYVPAAFHGYLPSGQPPEPEAPAPVVQAVPEQAPAPTPKPRGRKPKVFAAGKSITFHEDAADKNSRILEGVITAGPDGEGWYTVNSNNTYLDVHTDEILV